MLIDAALRNQEWAALVLGAWAGRAALEQNERWARAFFERRSELGYHRRGVFTRALSPERRRREARTRSSSRRCAATSRPCISVATSLRFWRAHEGEWSRALTEAVLEAFQAELSSVDKLQPRPSKFLYGVRSPYAPRHTARRVTDASITG